MANFGEAAAQEDLERVMSWAQHVIHHATTNNHMPELVLAIISRETRGLNVIGDRGHGHGLMQIDNSSFQPAEQRQWCQEWIKKGMDPGEGIRKGCEILRDKRMHLVRAGIGLPPDEFLRAYVAAYNTGEGNVLRCIREGLDVDAFTANHNYSKDVLERMKVFQKALVGL